MTHLRTEDKGKGTFCHKGRPRSKLLVTTMLADAAHLLTVAYSWTNTAAGSAVLTCCQNYRTSVLDFFFREEVELGGPAEDKTKHMTEDTKVGSCSIHISLFVNCQ